MKNYVIFEKDLTELVSEINAYVAEQRAANPTYTLQLFHIFEPVGEEFYNVIPSTETAFSSENLSVMKIAHYSIDNSARAIPIILPCLLIPSIDANNCVINIVSPKEDAMAYNDYIYNTEYYDIRDCEVIDTISSLENPILIPAGVHLSIKNPNVELAQFILIAFNEDISDRFA